MIGVAYPVLTPAAGSAQSLSRSLSPLNRIPAKASPATHRLRLFSPWKLLTHPPTRSFSRRIRHRKLQKAIQYPGIRAGSVQ